MPVSKMREENFKDGLAHLCQCVYNSFGDNLTIVEVGSYAGESAIIIHNHFPKSILHCVDSWIPYDELSESYDRECMASELKEAEKAFDKRVSLIPQIIKHKMNSENYAKRVGDRSIDWCYIDANHRKDAVIKDLCCWTPKIKYGGVIAGHDYIWPSVKEAVILMFGREPNITFIDGSWLYYA